MRVFLTGASGMVGRNLLEHPKASAYEWLIPSRAKLDLRDQKAVDDFYQTTRPDLVIHAAGVVGGIQANLREPVRFFVDNLDIGRNVIFGARKHKLPRLLNLSCSCLYPRAASLPLREDSILTGELEPSNEGYALARISAQRLCHYISAEDRAFSYKTLVSCNLYGRFDKFDPEHAHMIPAVIVKLHTAKQQKSPDTWIWGDGTARREFMYTADLAECVFQALENFSSLPDLCNVGPGEEYTITEFYQKIASVVGYQGKFRYDLSKPTGMARKVINTSRINKWGWRASTPLDEGLRLTYDYYLQCL